MANDLNAYHLTLTFRNVPEIPDLRATRKILKNFFRRQFWQERGYRGALISFEMTQNPVTRHWHPHYHCLILTDRRFDCCDDGKWTIPENQAVSDLWSDCTGGESFIVRGTAFNGRIEEMTKYMTKPQGLEMMNDADFEKLYRWSQRKRFVSTHGILYGINKQIEEEIRQEQEAEETPTFRPGDLYSAERLRYDRRLRDYVSVSVEYFVAGAVPTVSPPGGDE